MRYYRARPRNKNSQRVIDHFVHRIELIDNEMEVVKQGRSIKDEVFKWCNENIGKFIERWGVSTSHKKKIVFYFKSKEDALAFKIRWS